MRVTLTTALVGGIAAALGVALAGCPGPADPNDVLQCGLAARAAVVPCPTPRALERHLRDRWSLAATATVATTCVPGRFDGAGWMIRAVVEDAGAVAVAAFVLTPSCGALTDATLHDRPPGDEVDEVLDLDGDGRDEIVVRRSEVEAGGTSTSVDVLRVGDGRLAAAGKVRVVYDGLDPALADAAPVHCHGVVRYLARPEGGWFLEIEAIRSAESALCLATGTHRFELGSHGLRRR